MEKENGDIIKTIVTVAQKNNGRFVVDVPEESFSTIAQNRRYIGQMLMELGHQCMIGNWPQNMNNPNEYNHYLPHGDIINHRTDVLECPCRPTVDVVNKVVIHSALDGRVQYLECSYKDKHLWEVKYGNKKEGDS